MTTGLELRKEVMVKTIEKRTSRDNKNVESNITRLCMISYRTTISNIRSHSSTYKW